MAHVESGHVYRWERIIAQTTIISLSVVAHFLWQYAANEGKVSASTKELFVHASASLSVLIAFFLGVQFGQAATKRTDAMAIMVQLDGAKYFLRKRGIWLDRPRGYHPFYYMDPIFTASKAEDQRKLSADESRVKDRLQGLNTEFNNFDAFSYFNTLAGLLGKLHALAHVHTETNTFNRLFRGIVLIAYGVAIPLGSTILADTVGGSINGFTKWQFYVTVLVNILILIVYFSIDYSQTHSVKRLADLASIDNYWRLKDADWIPHNNFADETTTPETEIKRLYRHTHTRVNVRHNTTGRLKQK